MRGMADKELFGISEQLDCSDCVNRGGDWDCDHVHCRKGADTISRQAAFDALDAICDRGRETHEGRTDRCRRT